jgi:NADPH2:quinone reductase
VKAQVLSRFGDVSGFELRDVPVPELQPGCALVQIAATSVNPVDYKLRQHGSAMAPDLPAILGADFSGRVADRADDVQTLSVGDAVYGLGAGVRGAEGGALAEYLLVDARVLARKPRSLGFRNAAALPLAAITAWEGIERASVAAGHRVLVRGASGGVGHLAVQLARSRGAHVTALTSSAERAAILLGLGANVVLDSRDTTLGPTITRVTDGLGYDVVFDASGKTDISLLSATARLNGQIVAIAGRGHRDLEPLFGRGQSLHFVLVLIPMLYGFGRAAHGAILERIATLVDAGTVRPLVDPIRFRLREAADAHRFAESGRALGKVIIEVADL